MKITEEWLKEQGWEIHKYDSIPFKGLFSFATKMFGKDRADLDNSDRLTIYRDYEKNSGDYADCMIDNVETTEKLTEALALCGVIKTNPWHKSSEELPKMAYFTTDGDFSDLCVCINESGEHKILVLCEQGDCTYWAYGYDGEGLYDAEMDGEITHWMYVPEIKED